MNAGTASLHGKWALITGAGKRVGASIARTLHAEGAGIAVHYRSSAEEAGALAAELNARQANSALLVQGDLVKTDSLPGMVEELVGRCGRLDILVNNA